MLVTRALAKSSRTFFVDASGGHDSASGRTPASAWQTVTKINAAQLRSGDHVLFRRGEVWTGTTLIGATGVWYGAYGSGAKPIIDGAATVNCFLATNQHSITLQNLELRNGLDSGACFTTCTDIRVIDCDMHDVGNDALIFITNCARCAVLGGTFSNTTNRLGTYTSAGIEIADGGEHFLIDGAEIWNAKTANITIHNHDYGGGAITAIPAHVTIRNVSSHNSQGYGALVFRQADSPPAYARFENCRFESNTSEGLLINKSASYTAYPTQILVDGCTFKQNSRYGITVVGDEVTIQHCLFSTSAPGGGALTNLNINAAVNCHVYNCTFYGTYTGGFGLIQITGARTNGTTIRNCIFAADNGAPSMIVITAGAQTGFSSDYNLFDTPANLTTLSRFQFNGVNYTLPNWKTNAGAEAHSPEPASAQFVAAGTDFTLQGTSPAINAGVVISGVTDGALGNAPDLGYVEKA